MQWSLAVVWDSPGILCLAVHADSVVSRQFVPLLEVSHKLEGTLVALGFNLSERFGRIMVNPPALLWWLMQSCGHRQELSGSSLHLAGP